MLGKQGRSGEMEHSGSPWLWKSHPKTRAPHGLWAGSCRTSWPKLETGPLGMRSAPGAGAMPSCRYLLEMVLAPGDARDCTRSVLPSLLTKPRAPRARLPPTQPHHRAAMSGMMAGGHGGHGLPCLGVSSTAQGIPGTKSHHSPACHPQHASHKWQAHGRKGCPAWPCGPFF